MEVEGEAALLGVDRQGRHDYDDRDCAEGQELRREQEQAVGRRGHHLVGAVRWR
jgi:hypothetical protein